MPPSKLSKAQIEKLKELWEDGLTSTGHKEKITVAVEATGASEKTIKVSRLFEFVCQLIFCSISHRDTQPSHREQLPLKMHLIVIKVV